MAVNNLKCKECGLSYSSEKELHAHFKSHKMKIYEYYVKHFPRFDLFTGEQITFKNKESYFEADFETSLNLKKWIKQINPSEARDYICKFLLKRKEKKKPIFAFSEVELRSIKFLRIYQIAEMIGNYYEFCEKNGFEKKFSFPNSLSLKSNFSENEKDNFLSVVIDTREQKPFSFSIQTQVKKLDFGDYAIMKNGVMGSTFIERKSLMDFIGTLNKGYDRFCKEIERCIENSCDIVVIVESDLTSALTFNYSPHIRRNTKAHPDFIFHRLRTILNSYANVQFLFVEGKDNAAKIVEKIFCNDGISRKYDLQLLHELKIL